MPIYEYKCCCCATEFEHIRPIARRYMGTCPECDSVGILQISRPAPVAPDLTPYYDRGLGAHVESRSHRKRLMAEKSVAPVESTHRHGSKGTIFSFPGRTTESVPASGAYKK